MLLFQAAISAGHLEAPAAETTDSASRTPRLRREVSAMFAELVPPERSERRVSRNACAVIPPMLTEQEKIAVAIDDRNTIDPDPLLSLQIRKLSNAWSDEEHAAFFERFAAHDKQFHKIAEFMVNKSCNDVVEFYYKNKNRTAFKHRLKLINRLKERSLPFLRHGSHDALISNLRDGAVTTYVATRPGSDAFIWMRQRRAEEQEIARAEAELGRLVRELAARKEEKLKASSALSAALKVEKVKNSGKTSKEREKKDGSTSHDKDSKGSISLKEKGKGTTKDTTIAIKTEQPAGDIHRDLGACEREPGTNAFVEDQMDAGDSVHVAGSLSAADGSDLQAFDSALSKKVSKSRAIGWSLDEENVFVAFLQAHGKDWKKISSLMPGKSQVALRQQYKKMSEQGQLPENLVKSERSTVGGGVFMANPAKNAKAHARRMQQLTVSATASELVEAGTEHFALRDLSQVDSQQLGHLFMMHMMQQLQNSQGSDADRAQLAQIVNTLQEHRSQTFLQLIHEAAQLLVNQQAEAAAAAAGADMQGEGENDDAADEDEEAEVDDGCEHDGDIKETVESDGMRDVAHDDANADADEAVGCLDAGGEDAADTLVQEQEGDASPTGACSTFHHFSTAFLRFDPFEGFCDDTADMIEASSEEAAAVAGSSSGIQVSADADAECVAGTGAVADAAIEMQEDDIAAGLSPVFYQCANLSCLF